LISGAIVAVSGFREKKGNPIPVRVQLNTQLSKSEDVRVQQALSAAARAEQRTRIASTEISRLRAETDQLKSRIELLRKDLTRAPAPVSPP
jgi:chromosome segregation ATPase